MAYLVPEPKMQFFDDNGDPLAGGKVYTYEAGTDTPIVTYTTEAATTPNANPVILDAAGRAQIWISNDQPQRWKLKTSADVQIWDVDMIGADAIAYSVLRSDSFTGTGAQTAFTLTYEPRSILNMWVSIDGLTQTPTTDYTVSTTTLTFLTAPPLSSQIFVKYAQNFLYVDDYALAGPLSASGITGAAASGANTDITSLANFTVVGYMREAATVTVASAATTAIGAAASNNVDISGTTTITAFDTVADGVVKKGKFTGILTLTYNASTLILPGAANITTAVGDSYIARSNGSGAWIVLFYQRANGQSLVATGGGGATVGYGLGSVQTFTASGTYTKPAGLAYAKITSVGAGGGGGSSSGGGSTGGGGGGGGGTAIRYILGSFIGTTETVTIGAGGAASSNGGNTTFGALAQGGGGTGGATVTSTAGAGGAGGVGTVGTINLYGSGGMSGGPAGTTGGSGGSSSMGGGARGPAPNSAGIAASGYGGGGSGGCDGNAGGAGANGFVVVEEYYPT